MLQAVAEGVGVRVPTEALADWLGEAVPVRLAAALLLWLGEAVTVPLPLRVGVCVPLPLPPGIPGLPVKVG